MAKTKQDYIDMGGADAIAGRTVYSSGVPHFGWQRKAWTTGYEAQVAMAHARLAKGQEPASTPSTPRGPVIVGSAPRYVRDIQKKSAAILARIQWKHNRIGLGHRA